MRVSEDAAEVCEVCQKWRGQYLSITGATKGFPTLADAQGEGLFHPNCIHRLEYVTKRELRRLLAERETREDARRRAEAEARRAIEEVARSRFTTSDGVSVRGGVVKGDAADYGDGYRHDGHHNCYANAEAQEARCVYGLDVYPIHPANGMDRDAYEASARRAMADGEFIPTSALNGANPEEGRRKRLDTLRRLRDSPDGTFLRNIGKHHTNGFVKQDGEVYYVDGYSGDRYRIDFEKGAKARDMASGTMGARFAARQIEPSPSTSDSGEEYSGVVFIRPSVERAEYLATSKYTVGDRGASGLASR